MKPKLSSSKKKLTFIAIFLYAIFLVLYNLLRPIVSIGLYLFDERVAKIIDSKSASIYRDNIDRNICTSYGGVMIRGGLAGFEYCLIKAPDAGRTCISGFQCKTGLCMYGTYGDKQNFNNIMKRIRYFPFGVGSCKSDTNPYTYQLNISFGVIGDMLLFID